MIARKALLYVAALVVFALLTSCDVLKQNIATSGPKRYKVQLTQCLEDARREIDQDGEPREVTVTQLKEILTNYEKEMSSFGSYMAAKEAADFIDQARADQANSFKLYQEAKLKIDRVLDALQTEVK
ncbi:hypothetical protein IT575_07380 [bacterium]|nr:hypothetical protein [bacterium]